MSLVREPRQLFHGTRFRSQTAENIPGEHLRWKVLVRETRCLTSTFYAIWQVSNYDIIFSFFARRHSSSTSARDWGRSNGSCKVYHDWGACNPISRSAHPCRLRICCAKPSNLIKLGWICILSHDGGAYSSIRRNSSHPSL